MSPVPCRRPARKEVGSVLVEFALVLPVLLSLVLAMFTGGLAYSNKISLVEAVREGARYGVSLPVGTGSGAVSAWEGSVRSRVVTASDNDVAPADICVKLVLPIGSSDCGLGDPPGAANEPTIHLVKISATKPATLNLFFYQMNRVMTETLVARYERDTG